MCHLPRAIQENTPGAAVCLGKLEAVDEVVAFVLTAASPDRLQEVFQCCLKVSDIVLILIFLSAG